MSELERSRLIDAEWEPEDTSERKEKYLAEIIVYAQNRNGLLADVSKTMTEKNIDICSVNTRTSKQGIATMAMSFEVGSREELTMIIEKLKMIDSVLDIERTTG